MNHSLELGLSGFHWAGRHESAAPTDSPADVQSSQTLPGNSDVLSIYPKPNLRAPVSEVDYFLQDFPHSPSRMSFFPQESRQ